MVSTPSKGGSFRAEEPPELRSLTKTQVYRNLSILYLLPSAKSSCITRKYLAKVHREEVYTPKRSEILSFESILVPVDTLKVRAYTLGVLLSILEKLLLTKKIKSLGLDPTSPPDEQWVLRVLRFQDPTNVCEIFKGTVSTSMNPPPSSCTTL